MFKFPLGILEILEKRLLSEGLEGVNEIMDFTKESKESEPGSENAILPSIEEIIDRSNKVKVTKETIMALKKEYEQKYARNPPKEIKRLPTFFDIKSEEGKEISGSNKNVSVFTPVHVGRIKIHLLHIMSVKF